VKRYAKYYLEKLSRSVKKTHGNEKNWFLLEKMG
jgi:hypothetical protein